MCAWGSGEGRRCHAAECGGPSWGVGLMGLGGAPELQSSCPTSCFLCLSGSLSRAGPLPLLRQPPIMQPPLDLKQILPFPLEPAPTLGLFSNYSTVSSSLRLPHPSVTPALSRAHPCPLLLVSNSLSQLRNPPPLLLVNYKYCWRSGVLWRTITLIANIC